MKHNRKNIPAFLLAGCAAAFVIYILVTGGMKDRTAPVIHVPEGPLEVSVYDGRSTLLQGITAEDDRDGDVTKSLVVESISDIREGTVTVTYAAFDEANNTAKAQRKLQYTDYEGPRIILREPLVFQAGSSFNILDSVGADDPIDGDISHKVKASMVSGDSTMNTAGRYEVEFRVTNSLGYTTREVYTAEVVS